MAVYSKTESAVAVRMIIRKFPDRMALRGGDPHGIPVTLKDSRVRRVARHLAKLPNRGMYMGASINMNGKGPIWTV